MSILHRGRQRMDKSGVKYRFFIGFFPSNVEKAVYLQALRPDFGGFLMPAPYRLAPNGARFAAWRIPSRLPLEKLLIQAFSRFSRGETYQTSRQRRATIVELFAGQRRKAVYKRLPIESPDYIRGQDTKKRQLERGKVARARVAALLAV